MVLTPEDLAAIKNVSEPRLEQIDGRIADLAHKTNLRLTAIELRLDSIEYKLSQIAVFVPFENAFLIPPPKRQQNPD